MLLSRLRGAVLAGALVLSTACAGAQNGAAPATLLAEACSLPYTPVSTIQGHGMTTPLAGETVTTQGIVVGDFEGPAPALRGFFLQDLRGDGDVATSDGVFVFNGDRDDVRVGDVVRVTGVAGEHREQTQVAAENIVACGAGTVAPVDITLPFPDDTYPERYEGMLVRLPQTLYVTEHYQLGRFGEVVLSSGGRLPQPTNVAAPGAAALAVQAANDRNRIILADASYEQNPAMIAFARGGAPLSADNTLRGGDHASGIVGVLTQTSAAGTASGIGYRVRPVNALGGGAPSFTAANPRPMTPPAVGGTLRVASFNLLNYFNTFEGCRGGVGGDPVDCRGAGDATEFERQWRKTVAALRGLDADIVGVIEVENDGYGPQSAIADLVGRLNAATAPGAYAFIDADAATGQVNVLGSDAIKVGFIYRPARVSPVGRTAVLNTTSFVNGGESAPRNRPSLLQAFAQPDGARLLVSINHLKSKGSPCDVPDAGDGQANCNPARVFATRELLAWLRTDPTGTGESDVLILGDLNSYALEDPLTLFRQAGFTDLARERIGTQAYSFVFNGQWGTLDYALASPTLVPQVAGVAEWHINADEPPVLDFGMRFKTPEQQRSLYRADPFRSSDHDPILLGLRLTPPAAR